LGRSVLETVVEVIGTRTGYPVEMIEPDLDLEADLSVDSIKRAEIAGELASRLGLAGGDVEEFAKARTAAAIADLIGEQRPNVALGASDAPKAALGALNDAAARSASVEGGGGGMGGAPKATLGRSVLETVVEVIGTRTGYPVEMIEPDLDLEADLSIDSIKRAEIAGELTVRLGTGEIEELAKARTAAGIAELLDAGSPAVGESLMANLPGAEPTAGLSANGSGPESAVGPAAANGSGLPPVVGGPAVDRSEPRPVIVAPKRYLMTEFDLPPAAAPDIAGRRFLVLGVGPRAEALRTELAAHGAEAVVGDDVRPGFDGYLHLPEGDSVLPAAFPMYRAALAEHPRWLLTAGPAEGLRGFYRSVSREYPDTLARVVEGAQAAEFVAELSTVDREPVVIRDGRTRRGLRPQAHDLGLLGSSGAGPAGDGAAEAAAIGLDRDSVVLLVGGAKGITARFAATLAGATRCRVELLGRTPVPAGEDDHPHAKDARELRTALIDAGLKSPAEIEKTVRRIEGEREVRHTLRQLEALGSPVRYQSVDMLDAEAVHRAIKEIHAEYGRLDGIVYAAGVIEDKLVADKTPESFARVYGTKVDGARTLLDATADLPDEPKFVVLFGSIAATLGNRGQSDYAAANDALETLGRRWPAGRAVTVHWGPWAPTGDHDGMVSPALMRDYARRGIELIDPEEGTLGLLRELAWGRPDVSAVVHTASGW
jgi:NAD(P)-dependent dehydrogenase (short-subunit alcohol dehydrogenase family)/acyl carrier protein